MSRPILYLLLPDSTKPDGGESLREEYPGDLSDRASFLSWLRFQGEAFLRELTKDKE